MVAAYKSAGALNEARTVLDELLRGARDPAVAVSVLVEGAYLELEAGDLDRAQAQVQVARRRSEDAEVKAAAFYVAEALFAAGNDARALELYRAAEGHAELAPQVLYKLGFALLRTGELAAAETEFARLVAEHPKSELRGEALFLLGEARFRQEHWAEAAKALEELRRTNPEHEVMPKALFRLGVALEHAQDHAGAESVLTELARRFPEFENRIEAELWRGKALAAQKKARAARQAFERVVAEDRGELAAGARLGLGALHEEEGRTEEALSEYLKVAVLYAHEERVAEALLRAGLCLERLGNVEKAAAQYRELIEKHRESPFAKSAEERLKALRAR